MEGECYVGLSLIPVFYLPIVNEADFTSRS